MSIEAVSVEAKDITPGSLGFDDLDEIPDLGDPAASVFDRVTSHTLPSEAVAAAINAEPMEPAIAVTKVESEPPDAAVADTVPPAGAKEPAPNVQNQSEAAAKSLGNADTILSMDSASLEAARAQVREMEAAQRKQAQEAAAPVAPSTPPRGDSYTEELKVPKTGSSALLWLALAAAVGIGAALFFPRGHKSEDKATEPTTKAVAASPTTAQPAAEMPPAAPSESASAAPAEAPSAETAPSAVPSAAPPPSAVAEQPAAPPAPSAPPEIASASAPTTPAAPAAVMDESADTAALATLKKGQGFLFVASPIQTNVYVYGNLAGTTNQRITTNCGPRFLRLGTAPGQWQSEGFVQIVKCGAVTRVEMKP